MKKLLDAHAKTAEERQALSERLEREALERRKIEKTKGMLLGKLQAMEAKLIQARRKANPHTSPTSPPPPLCLRDSSPPLTGPLVVGGPLGAGFFSICTWCDWRTCLSTCQ